MDNSKKTKEIKKILRYLNLKDRTAQKIKDELVFCEIIKDSTNKDKEIEWQEISEFWQNQVIELQQQAENDRTELIKYYKQIIRTRDYKIQIIEENLRKISKEISEKESKIIGQNRKIIKLNREIESLKGTKNTENTQGAENA